MQRMAVSERLLFEGKIVLQYFISCRENLLKLRYKKKYFLWGKVVTFYS